MQIRGLKVFADVIVQVRTAGNLIQEHNLAYQLLIIRNNVIIRVVFVQGTIHFFYNFCNRRNTFFAVGNFCHAQCSDSARKLVHILEYLGIFDCILFVVFKKNFVTVLTAELASGYFHKAFDVRSFFTHHLRVVHINLDFENTRNAGNHNCRSKSNRNPFFVEN